MISTAFSVLVGKASTHPVSAYKYQDLVETLGGGTWVTSICQSSGKVNSLRRVYFSPWLIN